MPGADAAWPGGAAHLLDFDFAIIQPAQFDFRTRLALAG
jgi:hypothetical protein